MGSNSDNIKAVLFYQIELIGTMIFWGRNTLGRGQVSDEDL
jgi:hypothetical protein